MKTFQTESFYKGLLFTRIPYNKICIPQNISFIILPLPMHLRRRESLIKILKKFRELGLDTGLWLKMPKNEAEREKIRSFFSELQQGILNYPILIREDSRSSAENDWKPLCDEIRDMGFYPMLWTDEMSDIQKMDLCSSVLDMSDMIGGIKIERKLHRFTGIFRRYYRLYTNWDYGSFLKVMGWNGNTKDTG